MAQQCGVLVTIIKLYDEGWPHVLFFMLFRELGRKRKKREGGGSLNASVCVMKSVVSGERRREGSAKRQRR